MKCERCNQRAAKPQRCPGDRAYHRHGRVHTLSDGLEAVCDDCLIDVGREWENRRTAMSAMREALTEETP